MKRAITSIDASARGSPNTQQCKLKRCKSAFANLKRLGSSGALSPKMPPQSGRCSGDSSSIGWVVGEEISLTPRWWQQQQQHPSPIDLNDFAATTPRTGVVIGGSGPLRSFSIGSSCAGTSASSSLPPHPTSSAFSPRQGTTGSTGTGRRLFRDSEVTQEHSHNTGSSGGSPRTDEACYYRGRSARIVGSRRSSFSSASSFSPIPESAMLTAGDNDLIESTRCPFLQLHGHHDSMKGAARIGAATSIEICGGGGSDSPIVGDEYTGGFWTDPGSPASSIVGFEGEEDKEEDGRDDLACFAAISISSTATELQPAKRLTGCARQHEDLDVPVEIPGDRAVETWSPSWAQTARGYQRPSVKSGSSSSVDDPASPILLLRLQRRFEEMLLVSNVAT